MSMYTAPVPRCPEHRGQMRQRATLHGDVWDCRGWDGEGCSQVVTPHDIEWTRISDAQATRWVPGDSLLATPEYIREVRR